MSPYNESVSVVNTPFDISAEEDWDSDIFYQDPQSSVQRRMFFILSIVAMIVVGLSLFALPNSTGATSAPGVQEENSVPDQAPAEQVTIDDQASAASEIAMISSGGISSIFTPEVRYWESNIVGWANEHNLDPNIVATIMQIESCGDPQAVSGAGARGLFQVMPFHFSGNEEMLDPDTNARRGLNFYNEQLRYTGDDKLLSFAGYNGGYAASGGNYANWPDETKRYYNWAKGIYEDTLAGASQSETLETWLAAGGAAGCQRAAATLNIN